MQVLEHSARRLRLKFNQEWSTRWWIGSIIPLGCLILIGIGLWEPTETLTCWAEAEAAVQCRATRRYWWRSPQPQFHLAEVTEVIILSMRPVPGSGERTTYHLKLESATGQQRTFAGYTVDLADQEQRAIALQQYLANPEPTPWVYQDRPNRLAQAIMVVVLLGIGLGAGMIHLATPVTVMAELSRTSDQLIVTERYPGGEKVLRYYRLEDVVDVGVEKDMERELFYYRTWVRLKSGTELTLMIYTNSDHQHRAADLIKQFLRL